MRDVILACSTTLRVLYSRPCLAFLTMGIMQRGQKRAKQTEHFGMPLLQKVPDCWERSRGGQMVTDAARDVTPPDIMSEWRQNRRGATNWPPSSQFGGWMRVLPATGCYLLLKWGAGWTGSLKLCLFFPKYRTTALFATDKRGKVSARHGEAEHGKRRGFCFQCQCLLSHVLLAAGVKGKDATCKVAGMRLWILRRESLVDRGATGLTRRCPSC